MSDATFKCCFAKDLDEHDKVVDAKEIDAFDADTAAIQFAESTFGSILKEIVYGRSR